MGEAAKREKWRSTLHDILLATIGGLSLTCIRGLPFLYGEQVGYWLYGFRLYDPNFIPQDWLITKAFQHHILFGYFLYLLQMVGSLHVVTTIAQVAIMAAFSLGLLKLCRRFSEYSIAVYFSVLLYMGFVRPVEIGLGWQPFFLGYLVPSEVASALMILGLALLFERRYLASGILLGCAGAFHAQFLASFAPTICVTALITDVWRNRRALASFLIPLSLWWGALASYVGYGLLHSPPPTMDTMWILMKFRAAGDMTVANWDIALTAIWLVWIGIGGMAMSMLPNDQKFKELRICFIAAIVTCVVGVAQAVFINIPSITIMQFWRIAPLATLLSLLVVLDRSIHIAVAPEEAGKRDSIFLASVFIAGVFFASKSFMHNSPRALIWLMAIPVSVIAGSVANRILRDRCDRSKAILISFLTLTIGMMGLYSYRGAMFYSHDYLSAPVPASLGEMEKWVRENTPGDAILAIPPDLEYMRIRGRRAVVVDWKVTPVFGTDIQEWYRRICDISGMATQAPTYALLEEGYRGLDARRAEMLRNRYDASYVVIKSKEHVGSLAGLIERFRNTEYAVFEIPA